MANTRAILHSDMNSFYASVEMMLDPSLKGKAVAVCGATEERHGIVLAKSDLAKKAGVKTGDDLIDSWPYALNEISVRRKGAAMLCVDVVIDGIHLPTYWADGLVISTSSGSTAYSLSVGGPIVLPESKVLIVAPIAPHNLNMRPLVVPDSSVISLRMQSRDGGFEFSADNRTCVVGMDVPVDISVAQFSLKRVRLNSSNFINALTDKLYWGEDVRNIK